MKKMNYATPLCDVISISCNDIVCTSIGVQENDAGVGLPTLGWKNS